MLEETFVTLIATSSAMKVLTRKLPSLVGVLAVILFLASIVEIELTEFSRQIN